MGRLGIGLVEICRCNRLKPGPFAPSFYPEDSTRRCNVLSCHHPPFSDVGTPLYHVVAGRLEKAQHKIVKLWNERAIRAALFLMLSFSDFFLVAGGGLEPPTLGL